MEKPKQVRVKCVNERHDPACPVNLKVLEPKHHSVVRPACAADLNELFEIEQKCFPAPTAYSRRQLAYLILRANSAGFVESHRGAIRGFVIVTYRRPSLIGSIETLDVDPNYTRQGIGLKLLTTAEEDMQKRGKRRSQVEVSEGNKAVIELYKKAGYLLKERIKYYYRYEHQGTRDALRMVKVLQEDLLVPMSPLSAL